MSRRPTPPVIRPVAQVSEQPVPRTRGTTIQILIGPAEGAPNFVTRRFTIAPGGRIPCHRHDTIEHEQVMLEGEMVLGLGQNERTVRAGDSIFIPEGVAHWYENRGTAPVRFLCIVPNTDDYRTEWLEPPAD
jgi:quercetin dioxygenase-like cupin family protein